MSADATAAPAAGGAGARRFGPLQWLTRPRAPYQLILGCTALLLVLGVVMVTSASSVESYATVGSSFAIAKKQVVWVGIGLPAFFLGLKVPVRWYRKLGYPLLAIALVLLVAVLVPGIGAKVNGARRWISLPGGMELQPSEPAKLALVIWGADLLSRKERLLDQWRHLLIPLAPVTLVLAALVMSEPDMGTTIVLVTISCALLWIAGAPLGLFAGTGVVTAGGMGLLAVAAPYRLQRLTSFLDPFRHAQTTGYQAVQGIYALASGGWWGVGLGASREKWFYLPNQYTDYIFAIIGEELGLVGTLCVLGLFALLGYAGIRTAAMCSDPLARLLAGGITAWLISQALVNIGYVVGLLPVTGIPLPMVSFGGSALVPTLFAVGALAALARRPV